MKETQESYQLCIRDQGFLLNREVTFKDLQENVRAKNKKVRRILSKVSAGTNTNNLLVIIINHQRFSKGNK